MKTSIKSAFRLSSILIIILIIIFLQNSGATPDEYLYPNIEFESAFTAAKEIPLEWIEIMIFSKNPRTMEFYERPIKNSSLPRKRNEATNRYELQNILPLKLKVTDFPLKKIWILYRIDKTVTTYERPRNPYLRILYDRYKDSAWLFECPLSTNIEKFLIKGNQLTYNLADSQEPQQVEGISFSSSYFPRRRGRKAGRGYIRIDRISRFEEFIGKLNNDLPEKLKFETENNRIWQGNISFCPASGEASLGPGEIDKLLVQEGYNPIFIVIKDSPEDIILSQEKPWFIAPVAEKEGYHYELRNPKNKEKVIYTDLQNEDPSLWEKLPAEVKERYKIPTKIKAGEEVKLVVFWKSGHKDKYFPRTFFIYLHRATGEKYRTIVIKLEEGTAD